MYVIRLGQPPSPGKAAPAQPAARPSTRPIIARILWPALGFPAVIAPRTGASRNPADSDATRTVCVLLLSNTETLTPQDAARYLRFVAWHKRGTRTINAGARGSFSPGDLSVRNVVEGREEDKHGKALSFGADQRQRNGITVSLSKYVRAFYGRREIGLRYLYEIRVSEEASARLLIGDQFHLFWNKEAPDQTSHSNEMNLLLKEFAPARLRRPGLAFQDYPFLMDGYKFEYGGLHAPYNKAGRVEQPTEVLHPVFVRPKLKSPLTIGHVTDTHVDIRNDVYLRNLRRNGAQVRKATNGRPIEFNNWNEAFEAVYKHSQTSDLILMTGDLIDYGRGHIGKVETDNQLGNDGQYYFDRNWFLFYYLLAAKDHYRTPVYTILGNHDWRLNPYPPFAPSTPAPEEFVHNSRAFTAKEHEDTLKKVIEIAHGPGHDRWYAYADLKRDVVEIVKSAWKVGHLVPSWTFGRHAKLDFSNLPTYTSVESIAWYLLLINPFLDYQFALPTGHEFLMLDFAEDEELRNTEGGHTYGPRSLNCLTTLQQWFVERLISSPGRAKTIGIHVPPIGPRPNWYEKDLQTGTKTYAFKEGTPRYRNESWQWRTLQNVPLPLLAVIPSDPRDISPWLAATYGSFVHKDTRRWFIEKLVGSPSVRLVLSGHIHRQGLLAVYRRPLKISGEGLGARARILPVLAVRSVPAESINGAKAPFAARGYYGPPGPLYVNTTSAGPRGYQYIGEQWRPRSEPPGYSRIEISSDGTIGRVSGIFIQWGAPAATAAQAR